MSRRSSLALASLEDLSALELKEEWARRYGAPAPNIAAPLLRLGLAYRLQEQKLGGLGRETRLLLKRYGKAGPSHADTVALPRKLTAERGW